MIRTFKHRGLKRLYEHDDNSQVQANHLSRINDILGRLDFVKTPNFLSQPGYNLHPLRGNYKGFWSVKVSGNWRIIFRFKDGNAFDVNLIDYH